jgi:hypothetical protein
MYVIKLVIVFKAGRKNNKFQNLNDSMEKYSLHQPNISKIRKIN